MAGDWVGAEGMLSDASLASAKRAAEMILADKWARLEESRQEVFDYDYAEIARIVDKSEVNCRQIASRARRHVKAQRLRFDPSPEEQEELTVRFMDACRTGDMAGLVELLANDITLWSDGGGQVPAAINPIYGADRVARFLLGIIRRFPPDLVQPAWVNGQPGAIAYVQGRPLSVVTLDVAGGRVQAIRIVVNPDKLRRLRELRAGRWSAAGCDGLA